MKTFIFCTLLTFGFFILKCESQLSGINCNGTFPADSCCNFLNVPLKQIEESKKNTADYTLNTPQLLTKYGISFTTYNFTSPTGYKLTVFRCLTLPNKVSKGPVVLIMGLFAASEDWFVKDLATGDTLVQKLLEDGWEVWIPNPRGTQFSDGHENPSKDSSNPTNPYWTFDWNEMATEDVTTIVERICEISGYANIAYIGISMGGTQYFVAASQPGVNGTNFNNRISFAVLYAPAVYMKNVKGPIGLLGETAGPIAALAPNGELTLNLTSGLFGINPQTQILGELCNLPLGQAICANFAFTIMGFNLRNTNCSQIGFGLAHLPNPTSLRSLYHYGQEISSGKFAPWNPIYPIPSGIPDYNLNNIKAKTFIFYGGEDYLADQLDVENLLKYYAKQPSSPIVNSTLYHDYMHVDYLTGIDAVERVYKPTITYLNQYPPTKSI